MGMYLGRFSYTADAVRALVANPEDRSAAARSAIESLGGTLHGFWFAFGEYDGYFVMECPDNATAAAVAAAVGAGGALSKFETIPLISMEEGADAFRKAQSATYAPPSG
jgi:uncharacterized protein with GYD domain